MATHQATIIWRRGDANFSDQKYSRAHDWHFDGGAVIPASSSPAVVPLPFSRAENVDPEEAFIAALSSCHCLFFLSEAAAAGFVVDLYEDRASGNLGKIDGKIAIRTVHLRPHTVFMGQQPTAADLRQWHKAAHEQCFIANSVKTEVVVNL